MGAVNNVVHAVTIGAVIAGVGTGAVLSLAGTVSGKHDTYKPSIALGVGLLGLGVAGGIFARQAVWLLGEATPYLQTAAFAGGLGVLAGTVPAKLNANAHGF